MAARLLLGALESRAAWRALLLGGQWRLALSSWLQMCLQQGLTCKPKQASAVGRMGHVCSSVSCSTSAACAISAICAEGLELIGPNNDSLSRCVSYVRGDELQRVVHTEWALLGLASDCGQHSSR